MVVNTLYTIGYERSSPRELLDRLNALGVRYLADIREWPFSNRHGYTPEELAHGCILLGMEYMAYRTLGVPHELRARGRRNGLKSIREDYCSRLINIHLANRAFAHLVTLVSGNTGPVVLFCFERDHRTCHRSILAELLTSQIDNLTVEHLNSPPPPLEDRS